MTTEEIEVIVVVEVPIKNLGLMGACRLGETSFMFPGFFRAYEFKAIFVNFLSFEAGIVLCVVIPKVESCTLCPKKVPLFQRSVNEFT